MKLLGKLLFATDFSQSAESAFRMALAAAGTFHSEIIVLSAIPEIQGPEMAADIVRNMATQRLAGIVSEVRENGIRTREPVLVFGIPYDRIIHHAESADVNIIIVGSGDKGRKDKHRLGATAEKLIRASDKPVWVVKKDAPAAVRKILCPVDFSETSRRALDTAIHMARGFGARLSVLTVIEHLPGLGHLNVKLPAGEKAGWAKKQEERFESFLGGFDFHKVARETVMLEGKPHEEILATAARWKPDLIVMGSEGRSGLSRLLIGSVAEKVTREMPCSIITVKSEQAIRLRLEENINDIEAHIRQGKELLEKGFAHEAMDQFKLVIDKDIMYAPAWEGLGAAHRRLGHDDEAARCDERAAYIRRAHWEQRVEAEIRASRDPWGKKGPKKPGR